MDEMNEMRKSIDQLIDEAMEHLLDFRPGTKEYNECVSSLERLTELKSKIERRENETEIEYRKLLLEERKVENEEINFERKRKDEANRDTKELIMKAIGHGIQITAIVLPLAIYGKMYYDGLDFEKTGDYVSSTFVKNLIGKVFFKK